MSTTTETTTATVCDEHPICGHAALSDPTTGTVRCVAEDGTDLPASGAVTITLPRTLAEALADAANDRAEQTEDAANSEAPPEHRAELLDAATEYGAARDAVRAALDGAPAPESAPSSGETLRVLTLTEDAHALVVAALREHADTIAEESIDPVSDAGAAETLRDLADRIDGA